MTRHIALFAGIALTLAGCASFIEPEPTSIPEGYTLVWADEFREDGLPDQERWTYDTYWNDKGWFNGELQYYSAERLKNARVEDGVLIIEAHQEETPVDAFPDTNGQDYTSARLRTSGLASWQYGYFEIRAKLPCGRGLWPAIWTLPEGSNNWPEDGEIDIMEYVGWDTDTFYATVHTRDKNHTMGGGEGARYTSETACGAFHTHSLHWTEDELIVAVDGDPYFRYPKGDKGYGSWPFDRPHYLILNVAIGGWGGWEGVDPDAFPGRMDVDFVRVYQKR
ncbi:MAG: glycoside hydrolase family 16 protein [Pseudomonadota bacterium]